MILFRYQSPFYPEITSIPDIYTVTQNRQDSFFHQVEDQVERLNLYGALDSLERQINLLRDFKEKPALDSLRETYTLMQRYLATGAPDPSREDMTRSLCRDILAMADRLDFDRLASDSPGSYYSTARVLSSHPRTLEKTMAEFDEARMQYAVSVETGDYAPDIARQYEEALQHVFRTVMATPPGRFAPRDIELAINRAIDPDAPFELSSQIVSALLIGLLEHYDRMRLAALMSIYSGSDHTRLQAQALTAIMLGLGYHRNRPRYDKELEQQFLALADDLTIYPRVRDIFYSLLQTQDTRRVIEYFERNVLPQLQMMKPEDIKKIMDGSLSPDALSNPEWAEMLENSELGKRLRKLNEMQFEGADFMVMPFARLKMFPFFGSPGNWLLPFNANHSSLRQIRCESLDPLLDFLEKANVMCDSDKYSFVLAVSTIPPDRRDAMISSMTAGFEQMKEQLDAAAPVETVFKQETTRYLRNLYRLFTLSSKLFGTKRGSDGDPADLLERKYDILSLPYLGPLLCQREILELAAEFHFKRANYDAAEPLLESLSTMEGVELPRIREKTGLIMERRNRPAEAAAHYLQAELLNPDDPWLLAHLAAMLTACGRPDEAIERYERLQTLGHEEYLPDYATLLMRTGSHEAALLIWQRICFERKDDSLTARYRYPACMPEGAEEWWYELCETICHMENGDYGKASRDLPENLPDEWSIIPAMLSFIEGNYSVTIDHLHRLITPDAMQKAMECLTRFDSDTTPLTPPADYLMAFASRHAQRASCPLTDLRLLIDQATHS